MRKLKCKLTANELQLILVTVDESIAIIQGKRPHELSEVLIYRLFTLLDLQRKFRNRTSLAHPSDVFSLSFRLDEVLTLKNTLASWLRTPGLADIFMKLDKHIHPAVQLEL